MKKSPVIILTALFVFFFLFLGFNVNAQHKTDSIFNLLKTNPPDSVQFSCYDELCWETVGVNPDSALGFANKALGIAKKINDPAKIATAYSTISSVYYYKSKTMPAIENGLKAYEIRKGMKDKVPATKSLNNLAVMYEANGEIDKALELMQDADKNMQADDYIKSCIKNNLGSLYKKKGKYKEALDKFFEALRLKEKSKQSDIKDQASTLANISGIYKDLNDLKKARVYLDKAFNLGMTSNDILLKSQLLDQMGILCRNERNYKGAISYYKQSLDLKRQFGNPTIISISLLNIGTLFMATKNYEEALKYMNEAIEIKRRENDKLGLCIALNNLATIKNKLNNPREALNSVKEALQISEELNEKENRLVSYKTFADIYESIHDEKSSLFWLKRTIGLKDSLISSESQKQMMEMETKYQTEKKEKEIELLNKDKALQVKEITLKNSQRNGFIIGFILMLLLAVLTFRSLQQNKRKNRIITRQKQEVEKAKAVIEHQKEMVDEKQKEILDSIQYAKRIQTTILAHKNFVSEHIPQNFILFKPKDIVSGDFYWATSAKASVAESNTELFYLAVCDSTGHGVPGAFMSLLNIGFLSEAINEKNIIKPNEVLEYVRKRLINSISKEGQQDGFDGILLCIEIIRSVTEEPVVKSITYSAAHNAPLLISGRMYNSESRDAKDNGIVIELPKDKMPVGKGERTEPFKLNTIDVKKGDMLYLYTDGYADQFGGTKGKKFKYKQLEELLLDNHHLLLHEQQAKLESTFETWKGNLEQVDDVLVVGIKI